MLTPSQKLLRETFAMARRGLRAVFGFSLVVNLLMLAVPIYMLQVFDRVLTSRSEDTLLLLTLIVGVAVLTMAGLEAVRSNIMVRLSAWLDRRLAGTVLTGSIVTTLRTGSDPSVQGLRDLSTVRSFLSGPAIFPVLDSPWAPIFLTFVFMLHPYLGWLATIGACILFLLAVINELLTRKLMAASGQANIKAMYRAEAAVRNADAIEAMGMMPHLVKRWDDTNEVGLKLQTAAGARSGTITAFSKFIRLSLQVMMLGTGAWLAIHGEITPGAMIAGSILMGRALAPVEQAIASWKTAIAARNAYQRVKKQLIQMPPRAQSMPLPPPEGNLVVDGVTYMHPGQTEPVLRAVTFQLQAGDALGVVGPSGSGKTTLARLLLGNLAPRLGHVRLDGMEVSQWDPEDLGQHCGYLPQDVELFSASVKDNIARMGEVDSDKVVAAAQLAGCHDMILHFAKGYETPIGEGGAALSGGERQRIALARALYGEPRFVVLDEPNASLDAEGEHALLQALKALKGRGVTLVVVGHRQSILRYVDKLLVMRQGMVSDFGLRDQVLARLSGKPATEAVATP